jgi:hypothetical protein
MSDIRLESALSNEFVLLLEELEADFVEDAESSDRRLLVLCKLEISMNVRPSRMNSQGSSCRQAKAPRVASVDCFFMRHEDKVRYKRNGLFHKGIRDEGGSETEQFAAITPAHSTSDP